MEAKSRAGRLVSSYPATTENYPKAIEQLKKRFDCDDLLIQMYIRELLTLVMRNAATGRTKVE